MCKTLHAVSPAEVLTLPSCSIPMNSITNYKPSLVQIAPTCHLKDFTDFQLAPGWGSMGPYGTIAPSRYVSERRDAARLRVLWAVCGGRGASCWSPNLPPPGNDNGYGPREIVHLCSSQTGRRRHSNKFNIV